MYEWSKTWDRFVADRWAPWALAVLSVGNVWRGIEAALAGDALEAFADGAIFGFATSAVVGILARRRSRTQSAAT